MTDNEDKKTLTGIGALQNMPADKAVAVVTTGRMFFKLLCEALGEKGGHKQLFHWFEDFPNMPTTGEISPEGIYNAYVGAAIRLGWRIAENVSTVNMAPLPAEIEPRQGRLFMPATFHEMFFCGIRKEPFGPLIGWKLCVIAQELAEAQRAETSRGKRPSHPPPEFRKARIFTIKESVRRSNLFRERSGSVKDEHRIAAAEAFEQLALKRELQDEEIESLVKLVVSNYT